MNRAKAERCLKVVEQFVGPDWEPKLYPPGHEGDFWCVSLEGAEEWAIEIVQLEQKWPARVWVEPVASWCLGLYEERS